MSNRPGAPGFQPRGQQPGRGYDGPPGGYRGSPSHVESNDYLKGGYFDADGYLRPEVINVEADKVAQDLFDSRMAYGQARKFYSKVRYIKLQLDSKQPFKGQIWRIVALERDAADAVGREVAPLLFKVFIEKNVRLAKVDEAHFRKGFLEHFQSVMAYFRFRKPRD